MIKNKSLALFLLVLPVVGLLGHASNGETYKSNSPKDVPGTVADAELQGDITQRLFTEASQYDSECEHNVLKAEVYTSSQRSVITSEMGEEGRAMEQRLRASNQMHIEKWFVKTCDSVGEYEVLLLQAGTGTDIMVKKIGPLQ